MVSIFGPVRAGRMAYRNRREANLYPADARWILPEDPYSMGMRALVAYHLAEGGYGQAQEVIAARAGVTVGRAQLAGIARDLAGWVDEFYDQRAFGADTDLPDSDVIMMQADGKGIAVRPGHRASRASDAAHPGIKKMAEIVAVADFTPAVREPEDIAAPPARRKERPGPQARDKWVAASITETIEDMIGMAFNEGDRRDPYGIRQRVFLVDGNKQQLTAIAAHAGGGPPLPWTVTTLGSLGTGGTPMVTKYQKFGDGYKAEAVKLYRESNQTIAETARNLGLKESTLANWVKKDKDNEAVAVGEAPLTPAERTRIRELEADVRRLNMENAFLKKASAYFASQNL